MASERICRALFVAVTATLFALLALAAPASSSDKRIGSSPLKACRVGTHAVINSIHRCPRSGHGCTKRFDRQYHRYGFHCHDGYLEADVWRPLRRPLQIPRIAPGTTCPVSRPDDDVDWGHYRVGPGIGDGPAYPIGFEQPGSVLWFDYPPHPQSGFAGSAWSGQKVLWYTLPTIRGPGPILIRGRQLDGPNELRFDAPRLPLREMTITNLYARPSYTRLRAPGCYAYQIDGATFSKVIVFEAKVYRR